MAETHPVVAAVLAKMPVSAQGDTVTGYDRWLSAEYTACGPPEPLAAAYAIAALRWLIHELDPEDTRMEGSVRWMHRQIRDIEGGCPDGCPADNEI